jgi:Fur family transcriptional regulator, ferric uptake regulator
MIIKYSEEEIISMLKEYELRITEHRVATLMLLSRSRKPLTVHEVLAILRKKYDIDQATVYRNLGSLHEAGLVRRLDFNHGHAHYEFETGKASHSLVCSSCETIEKIEGVSIEDVVKKMVKKSKKFKTTTTHSMEIYGTCKKCS